MKALWMEYLYYLHTAIRIYIKDVSVDIFRSLFGALRQTSHLKTYLLYRMFAELRRIAGAERERHDVRRGGSECLRQKAKRTSKLSAYQRTCQSGTTQAAVTLQRPRQCPKRHHIPYIVHYF